MNIETSTALCSVSLADKGRIMSLKESLEDRSHAKLLSSYIKEIMNEKEIGFQQLDAIAVGKGPGSYTGLRIGVSTAKGICYGAHLPLLAISTLQILCNRLLTGGFHEADEVLTRPSTIICPMIDARRMEVYFALFDHQGEEIAEAKAKIIDNMTFNDILQDHQVVFLGSGAGKCRSVIDHPNAIFVDNVHPSASSLAVLSYKAFQIEQFEDTAYFEPFYLKDFVATVSKNRLST